MKLFKPKTKKTERSVEPSLEHNGPKIVEKPKKKRKMRNVLLCLAAIGFVFYAVITIIDQSVRIAEKKAELSELQQHINVVEIQSDYLEQVRNYTGSQKDEYMEKIAKEKLGYVSDGERIFINVAGD